MGKYVLSWVTRMGASAQQNHDDVKRLLDTFAKWQPPADQNWLQFLGRLDGQGGYAVVETDNPAGLANELAKFGTWLGFDVAPVVDITEGVASVAAGVEFRESI